MSQNDVPWIGTPSGGGQELREQRLSRTAIEQIRTQLRMRLVPGRRPVFVG